MRSRSLLIHKHEGSGVEFGPLSLTEPTDGSHVERTSGREDDE